MSKVPETVSDKSDYVDIVDIFRSYTVGQVSDKSDQREPSCPTSPTEPNQCRTEKTQSNQSCTTCPTGPTQKSEVGQDAGAPYGRSVAGRPLTSTGGLVPGSRPGQSLADALRQPPPPVARTPEAIETVWDEAIDLAHELSKPRKDKA